MVNESSIHFTSYKSLDLFRWSMNLQFIYRANESEQRWKRERSSL